MKKDKEDKDKDKKLLNEDKNKMKAEKDEDNRAGTASKIAVALPCHPPHQQHQLSPSLKLDEELPKEDKESARGEQRERGCRRGQFHQQCLLALDCPLRHFL